MADDDDDWVGEPPEGRHTRDRAQADFWRNQWQPAVAGGLVMLILLVILALVLLL